jgi:amidohydrolase
MSDFLKRACPALSSAPFSPIQPAVVSATQFHGGSADNVISNHAEIRGTIRAFDSDVRGTLESAIERTARGVVEAHGARYRFHLDRGYGPVVNDPIAAALVARAAEETVGAAALTDMAPIVGGDDFSAYQLEVPGCYFFVGIRSEALQAVYPHHPRFAIDEAALEIGYKVLSRSATLALAKPPRSSAT